MLEPLQARVRKLSLNTEPPSENDQHNDGSFCRIQFQAQIIQSLFTPILSYTMVLPVRIETTFSFLYIPTLYLAFNVVLVCLLSIPKKSDPNGSLKAQANDMLGYLLSTSIAIVTLTFSLTVLSIQIAAQAYSPRLLDEFLKDPVSKITVAVNLGSFAYGFVLTYFLKNEDEAPHVAIHVLSAHMLLVLLSFVYFIHHFVNGFRLETILHQASEDSWRAACHLETQQGVRDVDHAEELPNIPSNAYKVMADQSGYVAGYKLQNLLHAAKKLDICIRYHPNIGEFVAEGTLLAYVWDTNAEIETSDDNTKNAGNSNGFDKMDKPQSLKSRIKTDSSNSRKRVVKRMKRSFASEASSFHVLKRSSFGNDDSGDLSERFTEHRLGKLIRSGVEITALRDGRFDVLLGVQTLTDIAVKALSAAINDPMTAVQALDFLSTLFGRLAHLSFSIQCVRDSDGLIRACAPRRSFSYLLSVPGSIRFYGGSDLQVLYRIMRFYGEVGAVLKRLNAMDRITPVLAQLEQCLVTGRKHFAEDSLEFKSIQEVYQYSVDLMLASHGLILGENENPEKDLNALETTFVQPTPTFLETLPEEIKEAVAAVDQQVHGC